MKEPLSQNEALSFYVRKGQKFIKRQNFTKHPYRKEGGRIKFLLKNLYIDFGQKFIRKFYI